MKTQTHLSFLSMLLVVSSGLYTLPCVAAEYCSDAYYIDATLANGARWDMCWEQRNREGIVLHKIHYTPKSGERRMILNSANLAQIHVPYDDNGARYHDISDYGLGGSYMVGLNQTDCPAGDLLNFGDKSVICRRVSSSDQGFHYQTDHLQAEALSLFSVSRVGAYHYIPLWRFYEDGSIEPAIGATGALQRFGNANADYAGWPLAEGKVGLGHVHNFFWKLDFDLNGSSRDDLVEEINLVEQGNQSVVQVSSISTEAGRSVNPATARRWLIKDKVQTNDEGQAISYEIRLPQSEQRDVGPDSETFTREDIYFTTYKDCELYASHNPTLEGCADNLSGFVNHESLQGADLVVWPSTTFYHMPRAEDEPFMDAHWSYISLTPRDWEAHHPLSTVADISGTDLTPTPPVVTPPTPIPPTTPDPGTTPPSTNGNGGSPQVTPGLPHRTGGTGSFDYWLLLLLVLAKFSILRRSTRLI